MSDISRRGALKLLAANIALITAGCGKPPEAILPYVDMPERLTPGVPLRFASTLPLGGYGRGVLCTSVEGRPIKVSGNPLHPASLGATDLFAEAQVLSLYDPDRSRACRHNGAIVSFEAVVTALAERLGGLAGRNGAGLHLLTGPLTSPTSQRQIEALRQSFPRLAWHVHDPMDNPAAREGARLAFGRPLHILPRFEKAEVIVTLDADPLGPGPAQILAGRGFAARRQVRADTTAMSRIYALESAPSVTGAKADHRLTLPPESLGAVAVALARRLGADLPAPDLPAEAGPLIEAIGRDLTDHHGAALVLAGPSQPAEIMALVHWINHALAAPQDIREPFAGPEPGGLADLVAAIGRGEVDTLLI